MNHTFAKRLADLRKKAGISQKELAALLKITPATLSNYENGIYLPPLSKACLLASHLHTSLDYLTGLSLYDSNMYPPNKKISGKYSFFHLIRLLSTLENHELLDILYYAEFIKYKRKKAYEDASSKNITFVAEDRMYE